MSSPESRIDLACDRFEEAWRAGRRPRIEAHLAESPEPERPQLFGQLLRVELELRRRGGDEPTAEEYRLRFPDYPELVSSLFRMEPPAALAVSRPQPLELTPVGGDGSAHRGDPRATIGEDRGPSFSVSTSCRRQPDLTRDEYIRRFLQDREPFPGALAQGIPTTTRGPAEGESDGVVPAIITAIPEGGSPPPGAVPDAPDVAGYEILGELGRGGMGVVYQARQAKLKRLVALKMILPGTKARPAMRERFGIEAEAVARLQHPNIVQIYEVGEQDGRPFLCLEYAPGGSLAKTLAGTPQHPHDAARMVQTLARAIHAAHRHGIIHRDLKPANVLLTADGTLKITDFGLAKQLDAEEGPSLSGEVKGTPSYMAPEQAAGKTREIGPPADIYALGAILYEMLTGRPPFKAARPEATLALVLNEEPVAPGRLHPKLPRDLETICLKCLEKEPRRRYADAEALAEDLRRFLAHEPIVARPVGVGMRTLKWARRRPAAAALIAVIVLAVMGAGAGLLTYQDQRARFAKRELQRVQTELHLGQRAFAQEDWENAELHLTTALNQIRAEPKLAVLGVQVEPLLAEVNRRAAAEAARRKDRERFEAFQAQRNDALSRLILFTGDDPALNLEAKDAARDALARFGVTVDSGRRPVVDPSHFSKAEEEEIVTGCYELLLTLAEAESSARPGRPRDGRRDQIEQAIRILDRAETLGGATRAYHLRRALYLDRLGDGPGARRQRERADALQPTTASDFFLLGFEESRSNDLKPAIAHFEEALRRQPDHFWAQYGLATCSLRLQQWAAAKASLTACLAQQGAFAWLYSYRALAHGELGEYDAAEADFRKAEGLRPDKFTRYNLLVCRGAVRLRQEKYDAAVADLRAAVTLWPDSYQAYVNLAQAYQKQDKLGAALEALDHAIRHEPALASLHRERARVHLRRDDAAAALRDLDRAIALDPLGRKAADDHAERGRILSRGKSYTVALQAYEIALELRPDFAPVYRWRAEALLRLAEAAADAGAKRALYQQVTRALDRYLALGRPEADAYRVRGLVRAKLGDYAGALADDTRALGLEPDPPTLAARGWTYLLAFEAATLALPDFEAAIRLDPRNGDAHNGRGLARVRLGQDPRDAVSDAETALRLGPQEPRAPYNAARIYAQAVSRFDAKAIPPDLPLAWRGRYQDRAVQLLRQAIDLTPVAQRGTFWQTTIAPDAALDPIRRSSGFAQLMLENTGRSPARPGSARVASRPLGESRP